MYAERDESIDMVKGLCILLVVFAHLPRVGTFSGMLESAVQFVYSFHMPVFCIITGWLFGTKTLSWDNVIKVVDRMFKPYLVMSLVMMALSAFSELHGRDTTIAPIASPIEMLLRILGGAGGGVVWYLHTFGVAQLMALGAFWIIDRYYERKLLNDIMVACVVCFACLALRHCGFMVKAFLVPYFMAGFIFRRHDMPFSSLTPSVAALVVMLIPRTYSQQNYLWGICVFSVLLAFARIVCKSKHTIKWGGGGGMFHRTPFIADIYFPSNSFRGFETALQIRTYGRAKWHCPRLLYGCRNIGSMSIS
ncbi:MAG: acyltransferase family protein [Kiritimatiellae bacterium]|nr:acyltransferase family protein [Kiritimatiellia bacterium]